MYPFQIKTSSTRCNSFLDSVQQCQTASAAGRDREVEGGGVKQAHDKASERPEPPEPPPPPQHEGPEYYDPFDDPYGFMRMPRRRANSFSGGRVREFDEWYWTLPNERRNDDGDIPLGYAAADSYNRHHRDKTPEAARQRLRRRSERRKRGEETHTALLDGRVVNAGEAEVMAGGGATAPFCSSSSTSHPRNRHHAPGSLHRAGTSTPHQRPPGTVQLLPAIPTRRAASVPGSEHQRQPLPPAHHPRCPPPSPNLAATLAGVQPATYQYQTQQKRGPGTRSVGRSGRRLPLQGSTIQRKVTRGTFTSSSSSSSSRSREPATIPATPVQGPPLPCRGAVGYRTELCPLCGGAGAHIHEEDVEPVYGYTAQDFATQPGVSVQSGMWQVFLLHGSAPQNVT